LGHAPVEVILEQKISPADEGASLCSGAVQDITARRA
jgi:hypothetical protein